MKSNMTVEVEFLAGTDIKQAIEDAKEKAIKWDVAYVTFTFNGANFSIGQTADVEDALKQWYSGAPYGIVSN